MVVVGVLQGFGDGEVQGCYASLGGIKAGRKGIGKFPEVGGALATADGQIDITDEFAPADNLSDKAF